MVVYQLELDVVNESVRGRDRHRSLQVGDVLTPPPYRNTMMPIAYAASKRSVRADAGQAMLRFDAHGSKACLSFSGFT
jgi:hypothetical protein